MAKLNDSEVLQKVKFLTHFYYNKFNVKEPVEDIFADIYVNLAKYKYIERWDRKRPFHNYLSGFVYNHFCKLFKKEGYAVSRADHLEDYLYVDSQATLQSRIPAVAEGDSDLEIAIKELIKQYQQKEKFLSYVLYDENLFCLGVYETRIRKVREDDIILKRSTSQVLELAYKGLSQTEIKRVLQVSKSWVSKSMGEISSDPEFIALARDFGIKLDKNEKD